MRWIGRFLLWVFAIIGAVVVLFGAAIATFSATIQDRSPPIPDVAVLSLNWDKPQKEHYKTLPVFDSHPAATVLDTIEALKHAATIPQIKVLAVRLGASPIGFATAQELAAAVREFRNSGKKALAFSANLAAMGDGTPEYMLASAFDEVWMQPSGAVGLTGVALEIPYFEEGLSELGIEAEFEQRFEFKGGADPMTRRRMSAPVRQSLSAVVTGLLDQAISMIAEGRGLSTDTVRRLINDGPYTGRDALAAGLIDYLDYEDGFSDRVDQEAGPDAQWIDAGFVLAARPDEPEKDEGDENEDGGQDSGQDVSSGKIAVLYGIGPITGVSNDSPFGDSGFDSDGLVETLQTIAEGNEYDAVLFRVSSPGGAYGPSDTVWHAVGQVRAAGIPVVVSMGDIAASGGYFVAVGADRIVAQPTTITGSIGVYGGKFNAAELWSKLGVHWEQVTAGKNAGMWTVNRSFDPAERDRFATAIDFVYEDFTSKVAAGRRFDATTLDTVARGRVWLGTAALEAGLVDRLGGFTEALLEIRDLLDLPADARLKLTVLPKPKPPWEAIIESMQSGDFSLSLAQMMGQAAETRLITRVESVLGDLDGILPAPGVLTSPPMRLRR